MISQVMIDRLKKSIGSNAVLFLKNNFRFEGVITNCDDQYVEILQKSNSKYKLIELDRISDADVDSGIEE